MYHQISFLNPSFLIKERSHIITIFLCILHHILEVIWILRNAQITVTFLFTFEMTTWCWNQKKVISNKSIVLNFLKDQHMLVQVGFQSSRRIRRISQLSLKHRIVKVIDWLIGQKDFSTSRCYWNDGKGMSINTILLRLYCVTVFTNEEEVDSIKNTIRTSNYPSRLYLILYIVKDSSKDCVYSLKGDKLVCVPQRIYPINRLRNIAVTNVKTSHLIVFDMDMWPASIFGMKAMSCRKSI